MTKARYIMIGGFLGAGKTTAILKLADHLSGKGRRVGLITNDQSIGLVDTAMLSSHGYDVEEITGGCFCCRFNSLMEAADRLSRETRPDVFIAEPVGSCTDLRAAVSFPLRKLYGADFEVAPLSVLVDPIRAMRILGMQPGKPFSPKVLYVYGKQLEEADVIVINKSDLLSPESLGELQDALRTAYPQAALYTVSAREGMGLEQWFEHIGESAMGTAAPPDVDYDLYAEGEALLGWFNAALRLAGAVPVDGNRLLVDLAEDVQRELASGGIEIAHLKMTLTPDEEGGDIGVLNLVRTDGESELSHTLRESLDSGELIVNLRGEGDPETLREAVMRAVGRVAGGFDVTIEHAESFRPAKPTPTYRLTTA